MGRYLFRLPDVGEGVAEAEIVAWHVAVGDTVSEDQSLVDVMTDKATVDMTAPVDGRVVALHGQVGDMVPVGGVLVELDVDGAGNADDGPAESAPTEPVAPEPSAPEPAPPPPAGSGGKPAFATRTPGEAPLAAPATRARAHAMGIPLQYVPGTGPGGRITADDLDAYIASGGAAGVPAASGGLAPRDGVREVKIVGMRRAIAERLEESARRIPQFSYVEELDLTELEALRADLNAHRADGQPRLTLLPFFMRALVQVLPEFPQINAHYDDDAGVLREHAPVHIGIATQTPAGLQVPVVRHAEARDLWDCAAELARLSAACRDGSVGREELSGSTITLTSLGPLGGIASTPLVNRPEVAILAPNRLVDRPVVQGPFMAVRKIMNLSGSFDHRIVDGYDAALFVGRLKRVLEHPALLFMA